MLRTLVSTRGGRLVVALLGMLTLSVIVGLIALWPPDGTQVGSSAGGPIQRADVDAVVRFNCPLSRREPCQGLRFELADGPNTGSRGELTLPGTSESPAIQPGDTIRVLRNDVIGGFEAPPPEAGQEAFAFVDFERRAPLGLLAVIFVVLVLVLARGQGLRSLLGLVISLVVVTQFIVPAILAGSSPLLVALIGALAVMLVTIALAHGLGPKSLAAVLGSAGTLLVTALLALIFVELAHITGFTAVESQALKGDAAFEGRSLSLAGLVLAGMVVGALGVLDDVTVSQASVVIALRRANPAQAFPRLFREALAVGRDHLSATVNTLVFAYVGAALPILLIFETQGTSLGDALNRESVATQVVGMLVGSVGLVLAVPLTTALAAWLARLVPAKILPADDHGHHH